MAEGPRKELVLRTFELSGRSGVPTGEPIPASRRYNLLRQPYAVFCSNELCAHFLEAECALPFWSEDCPERLGVLRCPECGAPVVRPPRNPDVPE